MTKPSPKDFLRSLGDTKEAVAESLRRLGVCGYRDDSLECPIANALREHAEIPFNAKHIRVLGDRITYENTDFIVHSACNTPKPVKDFIKSFDKSEITL